MGSLKVALLLVCAAMASGMTSHGGCQCDSSCSSTLGGLLPGNPYCYTDRDCCVKCAGVKAFGSCAGLCYDGCTPTPKPSISDWFRDITDNFASKFSDYTSEVRDQIEEKLQQLPDNLQELVDKADTELEKASRLDLSALGEELLAHLKAVRRLTAAQLKPLADRIKTWSVDNLTLFLNKLDDAQFGQAIEEFACIADWSTEQKQALASKAVSAIGDLTAWTEADVRKMGSLLAGLKDGDISKLKPVVAQAGLMALSLSTSLPTDKLKAWSARAKDVFGEVRQWDIDTWKSLGSLARGLAAGDLSEADMAAVGELSRVGGWDAEQMSALARRTAQLIGDLERADEEQWKLLAAYAAGLAVNDLKKVPRRAISSVARTVDGQLPLSSEQYAALADRAVELLGRPEGWSSETWREVGEAAKGIAAGDIAQLKQDGVAEMAKLVGLSPEQLASLLDKCASPARCGEAVLLTLGEPAKFFADEVAGLANLQAIGRLVEAKHPGAVAKTRQFAAEVKQFAVDNADASPTDLLRALGSAAADLDDFGVLAGKVDWSALSPTAVPRLSSSQVQAVVSNVKQQLKVTELSGLSVQNWVDLGAVAATVAGQLDTDTLGREDVQNLAAALAQVKAHLDGELPGLRAQVVAALGNQPVGSWTASDWQSAGHLAKALQTGDLNSVVKASFPFLRDVTPTACSGPEDVLTLAAKDWTAAQWRALGTRAVAVFGEITAWDDEAFETVGSLARGLGPADLSTAPESAIAHLAKVTCWSQSQLECLAKRAVQVLNAGRGVQSWGEAQWSSIGQLVKGLQQKDLEQLTSEGLSAMAQSAAGSQEWTLPQAVALSRRAVSLWGRAAAWSRSQVGVAQAFLKGLPARDLAEINPDALLGVSKAAVLEQLCASRALRALTADQLLRVGYLATGQRCQQEVVDLTAEQQASLAASVPPATITSGGSEGATCGALLVILAAAVATFA